MDNQYEQDVQFLAELRAHRLTEENGHSAGVYSATAGDDSYGTTAENTYTEMYSGYEDTPVREYCA